MGRTIDTVGESAGASMAAPSLPSGASGGDKSRTKRRGRNSSDLVSDDARLQYSVQHLAAATSDSNNRRTCVMCAARGVQRKTAIVCAGCPVDPKPFLCCRFWKELLLGVPYEAAGADQRPFCRLKDAAHYSSSIPCLAFARVDSKWCNTIFEDPKSIWTGFMP
jgi:hypothetical protein